MSRPWAISNGFPLIPQHEWPEISPLPQEIEEEESDRVRRYRLSEVMRQGEDPGCQAALDMHEREFIRRNGIHNLRSVVEVANEHEGILRLITNEYMGPMSKEVLERFKTGEWAVEKRNLFWDEQGRERQTYLEGKFGVRYSELQSRVRLGDEHQNCSHCGSISSRNFKCGREDENFKGHSSV